MTTRLRCNHSTSDGRRLLNRNPAKQQVKLNNNSKEDQHLEALEIAHKAVEVTSAKQAVDIVLLNTENNG